MPSPRKRTRSEAPSSADSSPQEERKQRTPSPKLSHRLFTFPNAIKRKHRQKQSASSSKQQSRKLPSASEDPPRQLPKSMMAVPSQEDVVSSGSVAHKILEKIGKLNSRVISLGDETFEEADQIVPVKTVESKTKARKPVGTPPDVRELVNAKLNDVEMDDTPGQAIHAKPPQLNNDIDASQSDQDKILKDGDLNPPAQLEESAPESLPNEKAETDDNKGHDDSEETPKTAIAVNEVVDIVYESHVTPQHKSCRFEEGERVVLSDGPHKGRSGMLTHKVGGTLAVVHCEDGSTLTVNQASLARPPERKAAGPWNGPEELTQKEKRDLNKLVTKALDANLRQSKLDIDRHMQLLESVVQALEGKTKSAVE